MRLALRSLFSRTRGPRNVVPIAGGRVTCSSAQHIGRRREQQDSFGFSDPNDASLLRTVGIVSAVADGMGALELGAEASRAAIQAFFQTLGTVSRRRSHVSEILETALVAANDAVVRLAQRAGASGEAGTTLAAAAVGPHGLHWISAGDSRVYVWRRGTLTQLTTDHVFSRRLQSDVAAGKLLPGDLARHPDRNALTSYLGEPTVPEIDRNTSAHALDSGDVVVLCTDGVHHALSSSDLSVLLNAGEHAADIAIRAAVQRERSNQDNMTIVTMAYDDNGRSGRRSRTPR